MELKIEKLKSTDIDKFIVLIKVFEDVFEKENFVMPNQNHLQKLLNKEDFFVFVALVENQVVAGLTAYTLQQYYSVYPLAYIYDLAVKTNLQRQGIGKSLIKSLTEYCKEKEYECVYVQAHKEDEHALDFYRSTGATEEQVVHFDYELKW